MPYTGSGKADTVGKLTRLDLEKSYSTWVRPNNSVLVVVGDTTLTELVPKLEKRLAAWKPGASLPKTIARVDAPKQPLVYLIDKPDALQSVIVAGGITPPINASAGNRAGHAERYLWRHVRQPFEHEPARRQALVLWRAERPAGHHRARPSIGMAPVQTDKTEESLDEMRKEFKEVVGARPPNQEELDKAKVAQGAGTARLARNPKRGGRSIRTILQGGLPDDYWDTYAAKVKALLPSAISRTPRRTLIDPEHLIWVIVGDRQIEKSVRELNLGEVRIIQAQ